MEDIFESADTYRRYLEKQSLLDLEGIKRRIDGETYPERLNLVLEEIDRKRQLETEAKVDQNIPIYKRAWYKVFPRSPFRKY